MSAMTTGNNAESIERGYRSLSSLFQPVVVKNNQCYRCEKPVYQAEKVGPVNEALYHKNCFRCKVCGQFLNLKNYWSNQTNNRDKDIYCYSHVPRVGGTSLDPNAIGIKAAVDAQKGYQKMSKKLRPEVREAGTMRVPSYGIQAMEMKRAISVTKQREFNQPQDHTGAHLDSDAMQIKGPLDAQRLMKYDKNVDSHHHYPPNIYKKKKRLLDAQKQLEEEHRREEDRLLEQITENRRQEIRRLSDDCNKEWQYKLKELTEHFEKEMNKKMKKMKDSEKKQMTIHFENQKKDLEMNIREKKTEKMKTMTMRIREKEQRMTADMVKEQSRQMLDLLAQEQEKLKEEIKQELKTPGPEKPPAEPEEIAEVLESLEITTTELPPPHPPGCRKKEIYTDPEVWASLDDKVIQVAENEQLTYTDLVQQLTDDLTTDLEKVRAIYRWITVKDLNVMEFDEALSSKDNPLGLLRGIKYGTETYHVLFMRLCSYAGLHCVEIKGHSKSVGYEPGMKILPDSFQNTWNAVLIEGDWRLVQCNWGARHLVLNKDKKKEKEKTKSSRDQIRYQYDEHYFMTDPDEFIQEFWAKDPEWQLLENPITLEEFEALPFVRSVFFHFGMRFEHGMAAVLEASEKGGYDIKLKFPEEFENDLVFYYQLRFADKERRLEATYRGTNLERYVFQTMIDNTVMFSIHLPTTGEFFFEVFANKIEDSNRFGSTDDTSTISPFRLKCACKFKIVCNNLNGKMHPLPDCASGEWGPLKGKRHYGIKHKSVKHPEKGLMMDLKESDNNSDSGSSESGFGETPDNPKAGIINVEDTVDLFFKVTKPLHFVAKLKMNNYETKVLDPFVHTRFDDEMLQITVTPPMVGQYGLDVYARPKDAGESATLQHAFKYLLNVMKVSNGVDLPRSIPRTTSRRDKWGPLPLCNELGIKPLSHKDPKITLDDKSRCVIEMFVPNNVQLSYQFLKEPDEDKNDQVTTSKDEREQRVRYTVEMAHQGNYMLSLFARKKDSEERSMPNVFNYLITSKKSSKETNGVGTKGEEKKSSIFRKSIFKSSSKDKS